MLFLREGKETNKEQLTEITTWQSQAVRCILSDCADTDVLLNIYNTSNEMKKSFHVGQFPSLWKFYLVFTVSGREVAVT